MNCTLCGTPVKAVGHTTKSYEPLDPTELQSELAEQHEVRYQEGLKAGWDSAANKFHNDLAEVAQLKTDFAELQKTALPLIGENARLREALARTIPHAECMQQRYKADEDRVQAAVDIRFARDQIESGAVCAEGGGMSPAEWLADEFALKPEHQADLPRNDRMTLHQIAIRHGYLAGWNAAIRAAMSHAVCAEECGRCYPDHNNCARTAIRTLQYMPDEHELGEKK